MAESNAAGLGLGSWCREYTVWPPPEKGDSHGEDLHLGPDEDILLRWHMDYGAVADSISVLPPSAHPCNTHTCAAWGDRMEVVGPEENVTNTK